MTARDPHCTKCRKPLESLDIPFCPWCRFPVRMIADRFRLQQKLDEGASGVVYSALDSERPHKQVAIKFLKAALLKQQGIRARFEREIEATALLAEKSTHVVQIEGKHGEDPTLGLYYVMELLEGVSLHNKLKSQTTPLSLREAFHITRQLCSVIGVAHHSGVLHRDLKPANIFLIEHEQDPTYVKLIDFGLTKRIDLHQQTAITQGSIGTPAYMSPEQSLNQEVGIPTDIYALGTILYELLSLETPFNTDAAATPMLAAMMQIMQQPIPLYMRQHAKHLPRELSDVVMRTLVKEPDQRPATAFALWEELHALELLPTKTLVAPTTPPTPMQSYAFLSESDDTLQAQPFDWNAIVHASSITELAPEEEDTLTTLASGELRHTDTALQVNAMTPGDVALLFPASESSSTSQLGNSPHKTSQPIPEQNKEVNPSFLSPISSSQSSSKQGFAKSNATEDLHPEAKQTLVSPMSLSFNQEPEQLQSTYTKRYLLWGFFLVLVSLAAMALFYRLG